MIIAHPTYLHAEPDFKAVLLNQLALLAVSVPILLQLPMTVSAMFLLFTFGRVAMLWFGANRLPKLALLLMLAAVVALVLGQVGTFVGLQGGMSLLLLLGSLKSFEGYARRDWQVSALVQIFLLAGAVLFDQSLWVGAWVLLCLMMIAVALAVLNELPVKQAIRQSGMAFALTLLPMMVLFVAMPRKDAPLWGVPQNPIAQSTTGLSESMKPGSIGNLVQSNEPAFTATFDNGFTPKQKDLYWRVMIMAERDNTGTWQVHKSHSDNASPSRLNPENTVAYQIVLEDDKGKIPALDYPTDRQPRRGIMREAGNILRVYSRQGVRGIHLNASLGDTLPHALTPPELALYTRLPSDTNLQTRALAKQLFEQSGGDVPTFITLAYQYFQQQGFSYTLQPPVLGSASPTDEFLFNSKQGFCEHYADAFVTLMRSAGVAARVVTGYQGGEWNGEFWQIRSKDAHAWTEVWLPEQQVWQRVDPTAAVSANRIDGGLENALSSDELSQLLSNRNWFSRFADNSQIYWQRWVVNFDGAQQRSLFAMLGFDKVNAQSILLVLALGLLPALLPLIFWLKRHARRDFDPMQHGFLQFKRLILGDDFPQAAALGANEMLQLLAQDNRLNDDIRRILHDYMRLNYAQSHAPSAAAARQWYRQAKRVGKKYRFVPAQTARKITYRIKV